MTLGAWMQVGDERFDSNEICRLYEMAIIHFCATCDD